jgi:ABC-type Fe3+-siderophore transport system permease subunit
MLSTSKRVGWALIVCAILLGAAVDLIMWQKYGWDAQFIQTLLRLGVGLAFIAAGVAMAAVARSPLMQPPEMKNVADMLDFVAAGFALIGGMMFGTGVFQQIMVL